MCIPERRFGDIVGSGAISLKPTSVLRTRRLRVAPVVFAAIALASFGTRAAEPNARRAWPPQSVRLEHHLPDWLYLGATHRTRYEYLRHQFRADRPGDDMALSLRTTLHGELRPGPLLAGAELIDARVYLPDDNAAIDTTHGDAIDVLQAYAGADIPDLFRPGAQGRVRVGRLTMDVGSRRLVARNRFRNTINAFTGVDLGWTSAADDEVRVFAALVVQRRPSQTEDIVDNRVELDRGQPNALFWGAHFGSRAGIADVRGEGYLFGLHEQDAHESATRNRQLVTPGLRVLRPDARGRVDGELEAAVQLGASRASARPEDVDDLRHLAWFLHAAVGYTFDASWSPRLVAMYDHASGDEDPDDDLDGRFDTLFGARRFEYGPTGLYGTFARSNMISGSLRFEAKPHATVDGFVGYRPVWLAQPRDAWTTSGIRDPSGDAGRFVGNQVEGRVRFSPWPGNISLEVGAAHTWLGRMPTRAPNATGNGDPTFVYAQLGLQI
jgi:hypothetical protein